MKSWELLSISNLITAVLFFSEHVFGRNTRDVCNRDPPDTSAVRLAGDNGYRVKIPGLHAENGYTPGQVYTGKYIIVTKFGYDRVCLFLQRVSEVFSVNSVTDSLSD